MKRLISIINFTLLIWLSDFATVLAEPYLAVKTGQQCSSCHVNPIGGGLRNAYGRAYGYSALPANVYDTNTANLGNISDFITLGGDLRYNAQHSENAANDQDSTFRMDSAQLYLALTAADTGLTLYLDQQVAPGSAINREAFVMYRAKSGHYVKAGKMFVPFGLRVEDDTSFVRQVTGYNFDASDHGVELGLEYTDTTINLFMTNGTSAVSNNDEKFQYGVRAEHLFSQFRAGVTYVINQGETLDQSIFNIYGGMAWGEAVLLGEVDWISSEQPDSADIEQLVSLAEVNYQLSKGLNLKFSAEYHDPNLDVSEDQETRYSLVAEYTPFSHLQLRGGVRKSDSIPQLPERERDLFFLQIHLYF